MVVQGLCWPKSPPPEKGSNQSQRSEGPSQTGQSRTVPFTRARAQKGKLFRAGSRGRHSHKYGESRLSGPPSNLLDSLDKASSKASNFMAAPNLYLHLRQTQQRHYSMGTRLSMFTSSRCHTHTNTYICARVHIHPSIHPSIHPCHSQSTSQTRLQEVYIRQYRHIDLLLALTIATIISHLSSELPRFAKA